MSLLHGTAPTPIQTGRTGQRKRKASNRSREGNEPSRVARKEKDPNWNHTEMLMLVRAKCQEFLDELDVDDLCTLMNTKESCWKRVVMSVTLVMALLVTIEPTHASTNGKNCCPIINALVIYTKKQAQIQRHTS